MPLREACRNISRSRVLSVIRLTHEALRRMGLSRPGIAVAGLNPHAGESGLFGEEERRAIAPAVRQARKQRLHAIGPLPPDTVFARHRAGEFDAVVAMTHDHGHIAVKPAGFASLGAGRLQTAGVNVTLGLPIIRTSVDHGTAFDIAGKGLSDPTSMIEAIGLAAQMSRENH
jgi:4-hydroxythreonine-4-phosphate dehydrogenase